MLKQAYQKRSKAKTMWKEHPVKVAQDHSAIVAENEYGVLIDLTLCADAMWNNLREPEQHSKMLHLHIAHCSCPCTTTVFSGD